MWARVSFPSGSVRREASATASRPLGLPSTPTSTLLNITGLLVGVRDILEAVCVGRIRTRPWIDCGFLLSSKPDPDPRAGQAWSGPAVARSEERRVGKEGRS